MPIQIIQRLSSPFMENGYFIYDNQNGKKECIIIDPGLEPQNFVQFIEERDLTPVAILCTHGHADHIAGIALLKEKYPKIITIIGEKDAKKLENPHENLSEPFGFPLSLPPADRVLFQNGEEVEAISLAGLEIEARHTPGHSAGHAIFWIKGTEPPALIVGDLIFERSIGRHDFPDGDFEALARSIRRHVYTFPDETILYPGHGDPTTVGNEKRYNRVVRGED